jgi:hypothetical protein
MGHVGKVYLVVNYDTYQNTERATGTDDGTPRGTEAGQKRDKQESSKAVKQNNTPVSDPVRPARGAYPAEFEAVWAAYPKRAGDNPKRGGFRAWQASVRRGHRPAAMLDGLHRYAKFCEATNLLGTQFVKQAATFFGPDEPWSDPWDVPLRVERGKPGRERNYDDPTRADYVGVVDGVATDELWRISAPRAS